MAKKKKPAPEPEAAPEAADEAPDYGPALAEAAREAVEEGIEAAFARAEQNELDKLAPAFVAADLMRQLNIAVAWATLEPDRPTAPNAAADRSSSRLKGPAGAVPCGDSSRAV